MRKGCFLFILLLLLCEIYPCNTVKSSVFTAMQLPYLLYPFKRIHIEILRKKKTIYGDINTSSQEKQLHRYKIQLTNTVYCYIYISGGYRNYDLGISV